MALSAVVQLLGQRKAAGILDMTAVDHIAEGRDLARGLALEQDSTHAFAIDAGGLLARAQIGDRFGPVGGCHPKRGPLAGPAAVEAEHQPRSLGRAPVYDGLNGKRPMPPDEQRPEALRKRKVAPPH